MADADDRVLDWVDAHLIPLVGLEPGQGYADLEPLRQQLAEVEVVGLGESTHGVHEFFTVKHRIVEFLVQELGFTAFALEASHAACQPINDYVLRGTGDRAAVLSGQHYLAWDTREFSALVDWLREHNETVDDDQKVSFHGLDAGYDEVGRASVRDYLARLAPERLTEVEATFTLLQTQEQRWPLATEAEVLLDAVAPLEDLERFLDEESSRLVARSSAAEFDRNRWFVHVMRQWVDPDWPREQHLTENLGHLRATAPPGARVILWLHNSHVAVETPADAEPRLGRRLRDQYGSGYWCLALEFGQGAFQTRALSDAGELGELLVTTMPAPPELSLPWLLARAATPAFVLPLRSGPGGQVDDWLHRSQLEHGGMWIATDPATLYEEVAVGEHYDGILFIRDVTCSHPTPNALAAAAAHLDF